MNLTLAEASEVIAIAVGLCDGDPRVTRYINRATERLLYTGKWKGTVVRYNIHHCGGILTLPQELETCLKASRLEHQIKVRNQWFEFVGSGPGPADFDWGGGFNLHDRGDGYFTMADIECGPVTLRIYCDVLEDAASTITIMGYDENQNPVRTEINGKWQDGETITLNPASPATFQTSAFHWTSIAQIVKSTTNGNVRLYSVDAHGNQSLLGVYGPNIKLPKFRRYYLPNWSRFGLEPFDLLFTLCKRRYMPVSEPNDLLIIQNLAALEDACKAIKLGDAEDEDGKNGLLESAVALLNGELNEHEGVPAAAMDVQIVPGFHSNVHAIL